MDQAPGPRISVSLATHSLPPPAEPAVQSAVNQLDAQPQQVDDPESEMSALQKKLIQQIEKYDHDMEMITQVCQFAPGSFLFAPATFSSVFYFCSACSFYSTQSLSTSNSVTATMLQAASKGSQSVVQHLVKRFVNVEDKVGMVGKLYNYVLDWNGLG